MKIIVAMDSFKGSISADNACKIIADSLSESHPEIKIIQKPMADGGEGTAAAMLRSTNATWIPKKVMGPLPQMQVQAGFAYIPDSKTAIVEMATASGIELLTKDQLDPMKTTTYGTGQLIAAASQYGVKKILLAVGGSATVDMGIGAAMAMGWKFLDHNKKEISLGAKDLHKIKTIEKPKAENLCEIEVLSDVTNKLLGPNGAARVFAPQKGAKPETVEKLETSIKHLSELIKKQIDKDVSDIPGSGAAGGLAAGAVAFANAKIVSGIEQIIKISKLPDSIKNADWIITGEGKFDSQSLQGKVVNGICQLAIKNKCKIAIIAGSVELTPQQYSAFGISEAIPLKKENMSIEYAIKNSPQLIAKAAKDFAQKWLT